MRISVIYDSQRGTTRAAATAMANMLSTRGHEAETVSVHDADPQNVADCDMLCVGSWTQGLFVVGQRPTQATLKFISRLPDLEGRPAVVFCTYKLATGPLLPILADAMEQRGADVIGRFEFRGPEPNDSFRAFADTFGKRADVVVAQGGGTPLKWARRLWMASAGLGGARNHESASLERLYAYWARCYDWSVRLDPGYMLGVRRMIRLTVRPGDRTLDLGCGTGLTTLAAADVAREVVAFDRSRAMLSRLERKLSARSVNNVMLRQGDFREVLPVEETFDSVVSAFAIVHVAAHERAGVYARLFRSLRPGGRLGLFAARGEQVKVFETVAGLSSDLRSCGFERVSVRDVDDVYRLVTATRPR